MNKRIIHGKNINSHKEVITVSNYQDKQAKQNQNKNQQKGQNKNQNQQNNQNKKDCNEQ